MYEHEGKKFVSLGSVIVIGVVLLVVGGGAGFLTATRVTRAQNAAHLDASEPSNVDFAPVWDAWNTLNSNFVPDAVASTSPLATTTAGVSQQEVWGMISGMADSLNDPYTFFLPPQQNTDFSSSMSGKFGGIGMQIDVKNNVLTVVSPLKGTPADKAGVKSGDLVLSIDKVSTTGMDVSTAVDKIRGTPGTIVTLSMFRTGWSAPHDVKIARAVINVPIVTTDKKSGGVFVIAVTQFTSNAADLFRNALREFVVSGDTKLILDLRGNPGGYLDAAVEMGSWFLPSGAVIVTEDYHGHAENVIHRSLGYDVFNKNLKMAILVDKGSASASEILSDALRHYGIAKLVGTNTFGKGVVQELFPITDTTSLKVTVARWLGPDGKQIPHEGITPDVMATTSDAAVTAGKDPQMDAALHLLSQ